ncbi:hypothetical protein [Mesorhizobium sp.]|uniref:hypothetical protein n=1 Tax=Mesorhizobium sp. TaxID=1871066 RepID=UPI0011F8FD8E|nr:hypothetical protein [Mesorhizobium sp.]TIQ05741.1 MAG: hypothetical protein E5X50_19820 [Mesorhizobium sp.]
MARMSIYVTDELKERMDSRPNDNWSGIAQRAFELQLNSTLKGDSDMTAVIERLRASKAKVEEQQRPEWTRYGRDWATDDAEYDQLVRVGKIDLDLVDEDDLLAELGHAMSDDPDADISEKTSLACVMMTGEEDRMPTPQQIAWYIEGAQEVWEEVRDQI